MLYSLVVRFCPRADLVPHNDLGRGLHGLFFRLLSRVDCRYAHRIHKSQGLKPFTVSPVSFVARPLPSPPAVFPAGRLCQVRFTLLEDRPFANLAERFVIDRGEDRLDIHRTPIDIDSILVVDNPKEPWAGYANHLDLWDQAQPTNRITLQFVSPTTFRQGNKNMPLPVPRLVFGSLATRWNHFCQQPELHPDILGYVDQHVYPVAHDLSTVLLDYGGGQKYVGFTGTCTFGLNPPKNDEALELARQVAVLADFAFFSGVGQKTTMGMGQTRRIRHRDQMREVVDAVATKR